MGLKTTGNDLDNAWIAFDNVRLPRSSLLNAHATVDAHGGYELTTPGLSPFEMIGQRLYTGRVRVLRAVPTQHQSTGPWALTSALCG